MRSDSDEPGSSQVLAGSCGRTVSGVSDCDAGERGTWPLANALSVMLTLFPTVPEMAPQIMNGSFPPDIASRACTLLCLACSMCNYVSFSMCAVCPPRFSEPSRADIPPRRPRSKWDDCSWFRSCARTDTTRMLNDFQTWAVRSVDGTRVLREHRGLPNLARLLAGPIRSHPLRAINPRLVVSSRSIAIAPGPAPGAARYFGVVDLVHEERWREDACSSWASRADCKRPGGGLVFFARKPGPRPSCVPYKHLPRETRPDACRIMNRLHYYTAAFAIMQRRSNGSSALVALPEPVLQDFVVSSNLAVLLSRNATTGVPTLYAVGGEHVSEDDGLTRSESVAGARPADGLSAVRAETLADIVRRTWHPDAVETRIGRPAHNLLDGRHRGCAGIACTRRWLAAARHSRNQPVCTLSASSASSDEACALTVPSCPCTGASRDSSSTRPRPS